MKFKVTISELCKKKIKGLEKKYISIRKDVSQIVLKLQESPILGIPLGKNCYKIRIAIKSKGKGKSGGGRIITYYYSEGKEVYLLNIYDKSELDNIADSELDDLISGL